MMNHVPSEAFSFKEFFATKKILLAPLAGVSDAIFRQLCIEHGADLGYTEMISAAGLSFANEKTRSLLELAPNERYVAVQLFGHDPAVMASQASWIEETLGKNLAYIDINMGCPVRKVVKKGEGAALIKNPELAATIVSEVTNAVSCAVTVKTRLGWNIGDSSIVNFAPLLEQAGASGICIHGRFAMQYYHGTSDAHAIAKVRNRIQGVLIANGDVHDAKSAQTLFDTTGAQAIMIGRAAMGNPWVFSQITDSLQGKPPYEVTYYDCLQVARENARLLACKDTRSLVRMRKQSMHYLAGFPHACTFRARINDCVSLEDFENVFSQIEAELGEEAYAARSL